MMTDLVRPSSVPANPYSLFNLATVFDLSPEFGAVKVGSDTYFLDMVTGKAAVFNAGWEEEVFGQRGRLAKGLSLEDEGGEG